MQQSLDACLDFAHVSNIVRTAPAFVPGRVRQGDSWPLPSSTVEDVNASLRTR